MVKKQYIKSIVPIAVVVLPSIFITSFEINKMPTVSIALLLVLLLLFSKILSEKINFFQSHLKISFITFSSLQIIIMAVIAITQGQYLHIETIDWDIASYLVASQDIGKGFLPNETQWESKGPLLFYIYYFILTFTGKSFVLFKIINDILLYSISLILFFIIYRESKNNIYKSFFGTLFFSLSMSQPWAISEYSEVYSLFFISLAYLVLLKGRNTKSIFFLIGTLLSLSTLINQGSVLFIIPFLFYIFIKRTEISFAMFRNFSLGLVLPHVFFFLLYLINDLTTVYIATYIQIPLGYIQARFASFYELKIFLKEFFEFNPLLYFSFIAIGFYYAKYFFIDLVKRREVLNLINLFIGASLAFYFIGSHNYYHHLIFLIFFISVTFSKFPLNREVLVIFVFLTLSGISIFSSSFNKASENLSDISQVQNNYPLYQLSKVIDANFDSNYSIFALDYLLIPFYLDKPNYSYIIHPSNHFEDFIIKALHDLEIIDKDYVGEIILKKEPDVILCSQRMIIRGVPTKNTLYNCAVTDYKINYKQLETEIYKRSENLRFYVDPYKDLNTYVKLKD